MKFTLATALLFTTLTVANPAPAKPREALVKPAAPQPNSNPVIARTPSEFSEALSASHEKPRHVTEEAVPEIVARTAGIKLDTRDPKGSSSGGGGGRSGGGSSGGSGRGRARGGDSSNNSTDDEGAAPGMVSPSRVLELGALGVGVMEVVRLWM